MASVKKVGTHLREVLAAQHVGIQVIGVDVPHVHVQLVPFTTSDEYFHHPDMNAEPDHEVLAALAAKLAF